LKIIDFYNFAPFNDIKEKMGIDKNERANFKNHTTLEITSEWGRILGDGLEVSLHEIEECEDGSLEHQNHFGRKIAVFSKEINEDNSKVTLTYHVTWCHHLRNFTINNPHAKYIISQAPKDLKLVKDYDDDGNELFYEDFEICKHCLLFYNYDSYSHLTPEEKIEAAASFSMEKFAIAASKRTPIKKHTKAKKYMTPFQEQIQRIDMELTVTKKNPFKDDSRLNNQNFFLLQKIKRNHYLFEENIKELLFKEFKKCTCMIEDRVKFINNEIFFNLGYKDIILIEKYGRHQKFIYNKNYENIYI